MCHAYIIHAYFRLNSLALNPPVEGMNKRLILCPDDMHTQPVTLYNDCMNEK